MKLAQTLNIGRLAGAAAVAMTGANVATGAAAETAVKVLAGDPVAIISAVTQLVLAVGGVIGMFIGDRAGNTGAGTDSQAR